MKKLHLLIASLVMAGSASAQDTPAGPANVLPPPPWLNMAPDMSHWVITYEQSSGSQASATGGGSASENTPKIPPKTIEVTKTGKTILEKIATPMGSVTQIWRKDGCILVNSAGDKNWFVGSIPPSNDPFEEADYTTSDFAGFAWISAHDFTAIQVINGSKCLVFKDEVLTLSSPNRIAAESMAALALKAKGLPVNSSSIVKMVSDQYKVPVEADIDLKTLLPVSLNIGPTMRTYKFLPPPDAALELPEDAQLALNKYEQHIAAMRNMSAGTP